MSTHHPSTGSLTNQAGRILPLHTLNQETGGVLFLLLFDLKGNPSALLQVPSESEPRLDPTRPDQILTAMRELWANDSRSNAALCPVCQQHPDLGSSTRRLFAAPRQMTRDALERKDAQPVLHLVEDALRRLYDWLYLGEHELTNLRSVRARLTRGEGTPITCVVRGKAVSEVLSEAVEQLRPNGVIPERTRVPGREWHPYLILHSAYVEGASNRDIMSRLQISEGTFNRTRRRALQAVARFIQDMEVELYDNAE